MSYDPESPSLWIIVFLPGGGEVAGSRLEFDGQEKDKIGARKPMLGIQQGRAAYGQLWTSRNLSVIPLGTGGIDASLPP